MRKAKFAALGVVVSRLIKQLERSRIAATLELEETSLSDGEMESGGSSPRDPKSRRDRARIMESQNVSWDLFRIAQKRSDWAMHGLPRHQQAPRFLESFPVTESYTPSESLLVVDPLIGGVARLFWNPKGVQIAVRFTKDLARNPAVYSEISLAISPAHSQELLSPLEGTESVHEVTRVIQRLVESARNNVRIFGAHVGESYPESLRSLVFQLNSGRSDEDRQLDEPECAFRFGFVSGELPALAPNFSQVTSEILRGHYPLYAAVADRDLCLPSACQMMLTKHLTGKVRLYSRLGGELHIAIPEECTSFDERRASLMSFLSAFLYRPETLDDDTLLVGGGFLSRRVGPIGFRPSASSKRMEAVVRTWWELDPTSGVRGDYAFPLITSSQSLLTASGEMAILLPLSRTETRGIIALFSEGTLSALGLRLESVQGESPEGDDEFPRRAERVLWVSRKGQGLETDALVSFCKLVNNVTSVGRIRARQLKREALTLFAEKDYSVRVSKWSSEQTSQGLFKRWWNSVARVLFQS